MADAQKVTASKPKIGGAIYSAPTGTVLPTDAVSTLDAAYKNLGYVSEDGIVNNNSPEKEKTKAWGGDNVISSQTDKPDDFTFKLIEALNVDVLKLVYGPNNVTGDLDTGITIKANSEEQDNTCLVIDMIMKGGILKRIVIPSASITEVGEIKYADGDVVGYETTISAEPNSIGETHFEYIVKPTAKGATE